MGMSKYKLKLDIRIPLFENDKIYLNKCSDGDFILDTDESNEEFQTEFTPDELCRLDLRGFKLIKLEEDND